MRGAPLAWLAGKTLELLLHCRRRDRGNIVDDALLILRGKSHQLRRDLGSRGMTRVAMVGVKLEEEAVFNISRYDIF